MYSLNSSIDDQSKKHSLFISIACSLVLLFVVIDQMDSSSSLLSCTLLLWLARSMYLQISELDGLKFNHVGNLSVWIKKDVVARRNRFQRSQLGFMLSGTLVCFKSKYKAGLTKVYFISNRLGGLLAAFIATSVIHLSITLLKILNVKDSSLHDCIDAPEFYRECWQEDLEERKNGKQKLSYAGQRVLDSLYYVFTNSCLSRAVAHELRKLKALFRMP